MSVGARFVVYFLCFSQLTFWVAVAVIVLGAGIEGTIAGTKEAFNL